MQTDVKTIFNVQDETCAEVIYFDQYYALSGRTIAEIERYFLDIISTICSEYDFYINRIQWSGGLIINIKILALL